MESITGTHCPRYTEEATKTCAGCKNIKYCSVECQQADWATHRILCKTLKDFQERPSPDVRRAICFDDKSDKPCFMWKAVKQMTEDSDEEDGMQYEHANFIPHLQEGSFIRKMVIEENLWSSADMSYAILLYYDDNFMNSGVHRRNDAVGAATDGKCRFHWRGSMFVVCGTWDDDAYNLSKIHGMDLKSFADLVA